MKLLNVHNAHYRMRVIYDEVNVTFSLYRSYPNEEKLFCELTRTSNLQDDITYYLLHRCIILTNILSGLENHSVDVGDEVGVQFDVSEQLRLITQAINLAGKIQE